MTLPVLLLSFLPFFVIQPWAKKRVGMGTSAAFSSAGQ